MRKINIDEWYNLIEDLFKRLPDKSFTGVFGIPRGGVGIAVELANKLDIPLLEEPIEGCLVVDDLIDSGKTLQKYSDYHCEALIDKRVTTGSEWVEFWYEDSQQDSEDIITRMLETIGEDPNRPGLIDTPKRVIKMWKEIFRGYNETQKPKIAIFDNGEDGVEYDQMICDTGDFYSQCEHHMVPFYGKYWFSYIPDKKILGLSKVARVIDFYAAKLQIQERLVKDVLDYIEKEVQPLGIALVMEGEHLCKTMRGVKKKGKMRTADLRGVFKTKPEARQEFMRFVK